MIAARFGAQALPGQETAIRTPRPLIGRQHVLGHEVIDTDHLAIAGCWLADSIYIFPGATEEAHADAFRS
jgi:hypothetical protein